MVRGAYEASKDSTRISLLFCGKSTVAVVAYPRAEAKRENLGRAVSGLQMTIYLDQAEGAAVQGLRIQVACATPDRMTWS